ncbi:g8731 [Coccomyxa elongata]
MPQAQEKASPGFTKACSRTADTAKCCHACLSILGDCPSLVASSRTAGILFLSRKRQHQKKPEAPAPPAAAVAAESGSGPAQSEGPCAAEIWEQLLQEQTHRLRATAEASTAPYGAANARPAQRRPPAAIAWLRRCHVHEVEASISADNSGAHPIDMPPHEADHRDSPSSRFQRDYRLWGRQPVGSESPTAPSSGSVDPSRSVQLLSKHAPHPGNTDDKEQRSKLSNAQTEKNSGSPRSQRNSAPGEARKAAAAGKGTQKISGKYKTEGRQLYSRSGVWRTWGPAGAAHEPQAGNEIAVKPDQAGTGKTGSEGVASRPPVETPISWGLYARSYASVKGKLSPALRSQPGKAPEKDPASTGSAKAARAKPDIAGEGVLQN